ncbi:phospholipase A2 [Allorhizocola rhizosphaerae]|uniref:phospholipase A2 n=1 Tax=Allorhizocola rhizosphaerae TaxID=1872709 RepID=UPI000E3EADFA|nr:phospholipase A2 [Allorhizocola rhizosphaerae]
MRWISRAAMLTLGVAVALTVAAPASNAGTPLNPSVVPADFASVMGYEPVSATLADGTVRLVNPKGACSVPGQGRPFDFEVACQAHDFGYDLLRYAARTGTPTPPSTRADIDHLLVHDLHVQCAHQEACDATVVVYQAAVEFNSWRQVFGPPVSSSGLPRTAGLILLGLIGVFALIRRRQRLGAAGGLAHRGYRPR